MCNIYSHRKLTRRESELSHTYTHRPPKTRTYTPPPTHTLISYHSSSGGVVLSLSLSLSRNLLRRRRRRRARTLYHTYPRSSLRASLFSTLSLLSSSTSPVVRGAQRCVVRNTAARVFFITNKQKKKQPPARDTYQCVRITQCDKGGRRGAGREREREAIIFLGTVEVGARSLRAARASPPWFWRRSGASARCRTSCPRSSAMCSS